MIHDTHKFLVVAGPCALMPDEGRMIQLARDLKAAGADVFRAGLLKGGVFAPKDPTVWGMGFDRGAKLLEKIHDEVGIDVTTEVRTLEHIPAVPFCDIVWTAARLQQSLDAMRIMAACCRDSHQTLMIKRGPGATVRDLLGSISHVEDVGYPLESLWVIERGVSGISYSDVTRWRPDLLLIPQIKEHHPQVRVMFDASHSVGLRQYVAPMALAAVAAGVDGIMVEVLSVPDDSPSDAAQTIDVETFEVLVDHMQKVKEAVK